MKIVLMCSRDDYKTITKINNVILFKHHVVIWFYFVGGYREYLILGKNVPTVCDSATLTESPASPFTKILHGIRYFSEPKIYIEAYKAQDKAKGSEFAKWVFRVLMPDLRLKYQNADVTTNGHQTFSSSSAAVSLAGSLESTATVALASSSPGSTATVAVDEPIVVTAATNSSTTVI